LRQIDMDHLANQAPADLPLVGDGIPGWALAGTLGAATLGVATIPGGQVERHQQRDGDRLRQTVEVHRRDGSVWTAFARQLALPADPGEADRATRQASCVLGLLAQAVAAADTARQARGIMLDWNTAPPPWAAHYS
jgi:predicted Zn-dependent protease